MSWDAVFSQTLETKRAVLTPLVVADREGIAEIAFDPAIWDYFVARVDTPEDLDSFMTVGLADITAKRRAVFVIRDRVSGRIAGSTSFGNLAEADLRLEIGWSWLGKEFQGTGLNGHAKLALLTHAFDVLNCERVEFKTDVLNEPARRGLLNIGASEEGIFRSYNFMPGGRRRDAVYYSIIRSEWAGVRDHLMQRYVGTVDA